MGEKTEKKGVLRHFLPHTLSAICAQGEGIGFAEEQKWHLCSEFSTVHLNTEQRYQLEQQPWPRLCDVHHPTPELQIKLLSSFPPHNLSTGNSWGKNYNQFSHIVISFDSSKDPCSTVGTLLGGCHAHKAVQTHVKFSTLTGAAHSASLHGNSGGFM